MERKWYLEYYTWFTHRDNTVRVELEMKGKDEKTARAEAEAEWKSRSIHMPKGDSLGYFYEYPRFISGEPLVPEAQPA